jgi:hypothetical protein
MVDQEFFENGIERVNTSYAIAENIVFILLSIFGFLIMYPLGISGIPFVSIIYVIFILIMLGFVLRRQLCTTCYYYDKMCHCGWGKVSSTMFKKDSGNLEPGAKAALFTWTIIMGLPIFGMVIVLILGKSMVLHELIFSIPFIILVLITAVLHFKDCAKCKMRFICPASATKSK